MSLFGQFKTEQMRGAGESWEDKGKRGGQEVRSVEVSPQQVKGRMGDSFLAYPVGEWESRHQLLQAEYRSYLQDTYKNRPKSRTPEPAPTATRTITRRTKDVQSLYMGDIERRRKEVLQEPREAIYFPFGRPGGGAPLRDPKTRLLGDPQIPAVAEKSIAKEVSPTRITSYMTPQEVENKAKQQESMRRLLDEQMEERKWRGEEERRARLLEDQMEEERLNKQRQELEDEYRRELKSREQYENVRSEKLPPKPQSFAPPVPVQSLTDPPHKSSPYQASTYLSQPSNYLSQPSKYLSQPSKYLSQPFISDDRVQRMRADMAGRQQGLQDLIGRLKEESQGMALEKAEALREFDHLRESIQNRAAENEQKARRQQLGSYYHTGPWRDTYQPRVYQQESRFFPLAKAGRSVVSSHSPVYEGVRDRRRYEGVESADVQMQLTKLDGILDYCRGVVGPERAMQVVDEIREAEKDMDDRQVGGLDALVDVEESAKVPEAMA